MKLTPAWQKWLDGLLDTMMGGAFASAFDILTSPAGEFHWKLIGAAMLWNLKSYVKEHPRPPLIETTTTTTTTVAPVPGVTVETAVKETKLEPAPTPATSKEE